MIDTIIVAGLTAAIVVAIILGALAAFLERTANRSRAPREGSPNPSLNPYRNLTDDELVMGVDPYAKAVADQLKGRE